MSGAIKECKATNRNDVRQILALLVPLLKELILFLSVDPQGSISGFALIPPWAMQEYRPCRAPPHLPSYKETVGRSLFDELELVVVYHLSVIS